MVIKGTKRPPANFEGAYFFVETDPHSNNASKREERDPGAFLALRRVHSYENANMAYVVRTYNAPEDLVICAEWERASTNCVMLLGRPSLKVIQVPAHSLAVCCSFQPESPVT